MTLTEEQIAKINNDHAEALAAEEQQQAKDIAAATRAKFEELNMHMHPDTNEEDATAVEAVQIEASGFMDAHGSDDLVTAEMAVAAVIPTFLIKNPLNAARTEMLEREIGRMVIERAAERFR